ncbi:hypothetical protein HPB50_020477 [Hyalomma asiaticum]|uniref:Uncharacterized protein n=1 Tax=Hyalomma asiaticum TaxID=266040 RepID=A0ACB7T6G9_HYAAI|nr:hypothetical protein HPB50_020477 [Hyalomma asiaticum]
MDAKLVQMATNGGESRDDGDDEPPQEVPTSAKKRNLLHLLRNKVECSSGEDWLMRYAKQLEDAFLRLSMTAMQTSIMQLFSAK